MVKKHLKLEENMFFFDRIGNKNILLYPKSACCIFSMCTMLFCIILLFEVIFLKLMYLIYTHFGLKKIEKTSKQFFWRKMFSR